MKISRGLRGVIFSILLLIIILPGSSITRAEEQEETFRLNNHQSFSPGSDVTVRLFRPIASENNQFSFRLFRITDVVKFFTGLNRSYMYNGFDIWGKNKESLMQYTTPVKQWEADVRNEEKEDDDEEESSSSVAVGKLDEPGTYILQAVKDNQVAYCPIVVSDMAILYESDNKEIIAFAANAKTSVFAPNVRFELYNENKLLATSNANDEGIAVIKADSAVFNSEEYLLFAHIGEETLVNDPYFFFYGDGEDYLTYIYTSQPVYRPGQVVNFKAVIRTRQNGRLENVTGKTFDVSVMVKFNKKIYSTLLTTNEFGTISGSFKLDENADLGFYDIKIGGDEYGSGYTFEVEEYKKPEYFVIVETDKEQYSGKEVIKGTVSADYYFGSPVTSGTVTLTIFKNKYWRPWWYWSDFAWFYKHLETSAGKRDRIGLRYEMIQPHHETGELGPDGKFHFEYEAETDSNYDYEYIILAEVTDYSRRSVNGGKRVFITRGSFNLTTSPVQYFYKRGTEVKIRVNASDFSDKPVITPFQLIVNYPASKKNQDSSPGMADTLYGKTDAAGKAVIIFKPGNNKSGYFSYTVLAADEKNRTIKASGNFFVGNEDDYWFYRDNSGLEIITDKDSYEKGDSLTAFVFLPSENTELLLTMEANDVLTYRKYNVKEKSFTFSEKLTSKYTPGFNLSIMFVKDGEYYEASQYIAVFPKDEILDISIDRNKEKYKPGDEAIYNISVKDNSGNPVKNTELSVGVIDESIYAIRDETLDPIQEFFFAPQWSRLSSGSSLEEKETEGSSRRYTFADKNIRIINETGSESLSGQVIFEEGTNPGETVVFISSDKGFYKTIADSSGKYRFNNIPGGEYEILVSYDFEELRFVDKVKVSGETEYDIEVPEKKEYYYADMELAESGAELNVVKASKPMAQLRAGKNEQESIYAKAEIRSNFVDAAVWQAHLVTDENGKAVVKFKVPDNLTTWRTTIKGITKETLAGEQKDKVITRKNLLVRMETPRFFREGDEITISTIVHNYLDEKKKTKISFKADNLELVDSRINTPGYSTIMFDKAAGMYEINVDKSSELRIDWKVKVTSPVGEAVLNTEALTNEESDAVKLTVPIFPKGFREVNVMVSDFSENNKQEELEFNIPQGVDLRTTKLQFNVAPSLAGTILKALDELVEYPYGCVEQTMSRFLPAIIAANTFKELNTPLKAATINKLPDVVAKGLKRLYDYQHSDGGWGWWENDKTHPYMTAYVVYGLSLARAAGYNIDGNILQRGIENLYLQLKENHKNIDATTLSFMAYALSSARLEGADAGILTELISNLNREKAEPYSTALLIIAAENIQDKDLSAELTGKLLRQAANEQNFAYWGGQQFHYSWQDDKVQGTAFAVKALLKTNTNPELVNKAIKWLLMQKQGFSWRSTQETASVIFALTDYLKVTKELNPDFTASVYVNDIKVLDRHFTSEDIFKETGTIMLNGIDDKIIKNGNNKIRVVKAGSGKLYFSGITEYFSKEEVPENRDSKFNVRREYYILRPENDGDRIVYEKVKFRGKVKSGEDILVKTYVESDDDNLQYFMLEDMFPSGFEIVKETENYYIEGENDYPYYRHYGYRPWRWFYADKIYRDEKAVFFVTNTNEEMEFSYIIKAQIPGKYNIMPATGCLMYYPEVNGSSEMVSVEVTD